MINAEDLARIEAELNQADNARVQCMVNLKLHGVHAKYWEIRLEQKSTSEGENARYISTVKFPLGEAQKLGITKTLNGTKKLKAWLDTPEGLRYAIDWKLDYWRREHETYKRMLARKEKESVK